MHNVDIRNVSLGQIMYFVKVAEYKNITRTAEYFNLSQPTLSKKLKSLEAQLDLQLFFRSGKSFVLTPAGKYLYEMWHEMISSLEQEVQYAHVLQEGKTKSIVVACLDSFDPQIFMIPAIRAYREKYPNIHVRIESDAAQEIRRMLILGEVDLVFSIYYDFQEKELEEIQWEMLGDTPHCACMLKSNPLAGRAKLKIEDLKQSDFICISPQYLPEYSAMIQRMCKAGGFVPNITKYVSSANSLTLNIQGSRDVFICDRYYADLNSSEHCRIPIAGTDSGFVMAWRKDHLSPQLEAFCREVRGLFSEGEDSVKSESLLPIKGESGLQKNA